MGQKFFFWPKKCVMFFVRFLSDAFDASFLSMEIVSVLLKVRQNHNGFLKTTILPKNEQTTFFGLSVIWLNCFVCFLEEFEDSKKSFWRLQSLTGLLQGENKVFPVKFPHTGRNLFSLHGTHAMKAGFFLWSFSHGFAVKLIDL